MKIPFGLCALAVLMTPVLVIGQTPMAIAQTHVAQAQTQLTPQSALERIFSAPQIEADWFSPEFLAEVPLSELQEGRTILQQEFGNYRETRPVGQTYRVVFERGQLDASIQLNNQGQISSLLLREPS